MLEAITERVGVGSVHGPPALWHPIRQVGEQSARAALGPARFTDIVRRARQEPFAGALADAIALTEAIADGLSPPASNDNAMAAPVSFMVAPLTRRERQILTLMAQRLTDPEISNQLFLSPRTVNNHVAHIFDKLGVQPSGGGRAGRSPRSTDLSLRLSSLSDHPE